MWNTFSFSMSGGICSGAQFFLFLHLSFYFFVILCGFFILVDFKIDKALLYIRPTFIFTHSFSLFLGSFPAAVIYARKDRLHRPAHVATKTFQALRILVNDELNELHSGLRAARAALRPGGRLCVITFHSLEDRLVKRFLLGEDLSNLDQYHFSPRKQGDGKRIKGVGSGHWLPLQRKVINPHKDDVMDNPRGRSAKLRAVLRL